MGLLKSVIGSIGGTLADSWKEYFYCESLNNDILVSKGYKRIGNRSSNTKAEDNVITSGSNLIVNDGQCMLIVEQGKVRELCSESGEYTYDSEKTSSIFSGNLGEGVANTFRNIGERIGYGGNAPIDQRIYYFNVKEIVDNRFGTATPIPFRVVDKSLGLDIDVSIRCNGVYSYKIVDPIIFYANVCGNVDNFFNKEIIKNQMRNELMSAMQPVFGKLSNLGLRPNEIVLHCKELEELLNEELSDSWNKKRGIKITSLSLSSLSLTEDDQNIIKEAQRNAMYKNTTMAAATLVGAQAEALKEAAKNPNGAVNGFVGVGMAMNIGNNQNITNLYNMNSNNQEWKCDKCGTINNGNFCSNCGNKK